MFGGNMVKLEDIKVLMETEGFSDTEITAGTNLNDDLGMDSTEIVDLCVTVEKEFKIILDPDHFETVGELISEINKSEEA
jgi:acyl carrier protein